MGAHGTVSSDNIGFCDNIECGAFQACFFIYRLVNAFVFRHTGENLAAFRDFDSTHLGIVFFDNRNHFSFTGYLKRHRVRIQNIAVGGFHLDQFKAAIWELVR